MYVCVCQSILHATLVRFFELLGWVGSVRFGRSFSFARSLVRSLVRSVDALGEDQKSKAANTHLCTHLLASFLASFLLFFFSSHPDFKISGMHSRTSWWVFTGEGNIIIECAHNNEEMYTRLCSCSQSAAQQRLPERGSGRAEEWF